MINSKDILNSEKYIFRDTPFKLLMQKRIIKVLLVCSNYDIFMLEEDGQIEELLFKEYASLNLKYPPYFIHCDTQQKAIELLGKSSFDMVITMFNTKSIDVFSLAENIKSLFPDVPITALATFSKDATIRYEQLGTTNIDYIFSWMGNVQLLLAIIKLTEDKLNIDQDVERVGVQVILLVEDSVRFYSSYISLIYNTMYSQTKAFRNEGLNNHKRNLLMRGRPKVLLARNFEEAERYIATYKNNLLGIITDMTFPKGGELCHDAGIAIATITKKHAPETPIVLQSMNENNREKANAIGIQFISKNAIDLPLKIKQYFSESLAFGDFEFRTHTGGEVIARASNLKEFQERIATISEHSLTYHSRRNNFSRWLKARAQFQLAEILAPISPEDFPSIESFRKFVTNVLSLYRLQMNRDGISHFNPNTYDQYIHFSRAGTGSMGGKARGLAFADSLIHKYGLSDRYENTLVTTPRSLVFCSSFFDAFMQKNALYHIAFHGTDNQITDAFSTAQLPDEMLSVIKKFVAFSKRPLAVRSSSVLEDSHFCSFAGIYHTQMIYNDGTEPSKTANATAQAIKSVYASVYLQSSKMFFKATSNILDEEKMSAVLQEVCGTFNGQYYYPHISGTASSHNYYPIGSEQVSDGVCNIAIGLGSSIANGAPSVRFSPSFPQKAFHLASIEASMKSNQKKIDAISREKDSAFLSSGTESVRLRSVLNDRLVKQLCSIYDIENNVLRDSAFSEGINVTTFSSVLQHDFFPLAQIVSDILTISEKNLNAPVEIEFAVQLSADKKIPAQFQLLQLRPMPSSFPSSRTTITEELIAKSIIHSKNVMGNGSKTGIKSIIYISEHAFGLLPPEVICNLLRKKNAEYLERKRTFMLVGPGRWGSSDGTLGIPVIWADICGTSAIVEYQLKQKHADKSNGSHFFHNMVNFGVHYFMVNDCDKNIILEASTDVSEPIDGVFEINGNFELISNGEDSEGILIASDLAKQQ